MNSSTTDANAKKAFASLLLNTKPAVESKMEAMFRDRAKLRAPNGPEVRDVVAVAHDLSMRGGKRFRAALLAAAYFGVSPRGAKDNALLGGVSLEMLQSYLLIQDDWMDGDVERRGGPSAHIALAKKLGGGPLLPERAGGVAALLASDLVWGLAVSALLSTKVEPAIRVRALDELMRIHEDVVAGQVIDTLAKKPDIEVLHDLKTGSYTVRGPLALGAILGGAGKPVLRALARYADPLGVAFQLRDDLLGVFGTEAEAGRPQGSDLRSGKNTSVLRHASPKLRGAGKRALATVWKKGDAKQRDVLTAVDAISATGAREAVEMRLASLCDRAEREASKLPLSASAKAQLTGASLAIRLGPGGREAR
jgi:geranylgeranyl diphosphate synthase, type I